MFLLLYFEVILDFEQSESAEVVFEKIATELQLFFFLLICVSPSSSFLCVFYQYLLAEDCVKSERYRMYEFRYYTH